MDLGAKGNAAVKDAFENYVARFPRGAARAGGAGRRVMLTGFGLFEGIRFNIAGSLVASLANPEFWPADGNPEDFPRAAARPGRLDVSAGGALVASRTLERPSGRVDFCFANFDVAWDLAPALLAHELGNFKPELLFMIGRGGNCAELEGGAINRSNRLPGFTADGVSLSETCLPASDRLLDDYAPDVELALSWDRHALMTAMAPGFQALGIELKSHAAARPSNTYICNSLAFAAAHMAAGRELRLAGGAVSIAATAELRGLRTAFLHLPKLDERFPSEREATPVIFELARAVLAGIDSSL